MPHDYVEEFRNYVKKYGFQINEEWFFRSSFMHNNMKRYFSQHVTDLGVEPVGILYNLRRQIEIPDNHYYTKRSDPTVMYKVKAVLINTESLKRSVLAEA